MAVTTYTAPEYDEKKYSQGIDTSYYTKAINTYTKQANKQRASQVADAKSAQKSALRQAYVSNVQNRLGLNNSLATAGIRGGATETANLQLQNQYGQAVNAANTEYNSAVKSINQAVDQNIADYTSDMQSRAEEYRQNTAQAKWQADREDSLNKYNATNEYWSNHWTGVYQGVTTMATLNRALADAQTALANAKTPEGRIQQEQRIKAIQTRKGELETTLYNRAQEAKEWNLKVRQTNANIANTRANTAATTASTAATRANTANANKTADMNKENNTVQYWTNYYTSYYSGASKKTCQTALADAKKRLAKAKTPGDRIRIRAEIAGIQTRYGVIKNK